MAPPNPIAADDLALVTDPDAEQQATWDEFEAADRAAANPVAVIPGDVSEPTPDPDPEPAAEAAPAADPWAGVSPELKKAHDDAIAERNEFRRVHGSAEGLRKQVSNLQREKNALTAAPPAGEPDGEDEEPGGMDAADFVAAKKEYPEVVSPVETILRDFEGRLRTAEGTLGGLTEQQVEEHVGKQYGLVIRDHPDYHAAMASVDFRNWLDAAPAYVRAGVERNSQECVDGPEVSALVTQFKTDTGWKPEPKPAADPAPNQPAPDARRAAQLESASTPRPKGPSAATRSEPPEDDPQAIWDYWDAHDKQKAATA